MAYKRIHAKHVIHQIEKVPRILNRTPQYSFSENLGFLFTNPRYRAGVNIENFFTLTPFDKNHQFPFGWSANFARHFPLGSTILSPAIHYYYKTTPDGIQFSSYLTEKYHALRPGIIANFSDNIFISLKTYHELKQYKNDITKDLELKAGVNIGYGLQTRHKIRNFKSIKGLKPPYLGLSVTRFFMQDHANP